LLATIAQCAQGRQEHIGLGRDQQLAVVRGHDDDVADAGAFERNAGLDVRIDGALPRGVLQQGPPGRAGGSRAALHRALVDDAGWFRVRGISHGGDRRRSMGADLPRAAVTTHP
jgi:hypothetical protein